MGLCQWVPLLRFSSPSLYFILLKQTFDCWPENLRQATPVSQTHDKTLSSNLGWKEQAVHSLNSHGFPTKTKTTSPGHSWAHSESVCRSPTASFLISKKFRRSARLEAQWRLPSTPLFKMPGMEAWLSGQGFWLWTMFLGWRYRSRFSCGFRGSQALEHSLGLLTQSLVLSRGGWISDALLGFWMQADQQGEEGCCSGLLFAC